MMNVRVRRCRIKKIGVAAGPEQIAYPAFFPKAIEANMPQVQCARRRQIAVAWGDACALDQRRIQTETECTGRVEATLSPNIGVSPTCVARLGYPQPVLLDRGIPHILLHNLFLGYNFLGPKNVH